jgi:hypothetical protein
VGSSICSQRWDAAQSTKSTDLAEPVRALVDAQGRGSQNIAARLGHVAGTRAGDFARGGRRKMGCRDLLLGPHVIAA